MGDAGWYLERFPGPEVLQLLLKGHTERLLRTVARGRALANPDIDLVAKDPALTAQLGVAKAAAEKIAAQGALAKLTPAEETALEFFIQLAARPALFVQGGRIGIAPRNWPDLDTRRETITATLAAVGRLDLAGVEHGTGFLLSERRLLTNNHVVWALVRREGDPTPLKTWASDPVLFQTRVREANEAWKDGQRAPTFDQAVELGSSAVERTIVASVSMCHDAADFAVLELREKPVTAARLSLATTGGVIERRAVYCVGYPALLPSDTPMHQFERAFPGADQLCVKRLSPGRLLTHVPGKHVKHDASTLGGSSGSPVLDLETGEVLAIHYGGSYTTRANYAVPLWEHLAHPVLQRASGAS